MRSPTFLAGVLVWALASSACVTTTTNQRASVLEFLFPEGTEAIPPADVQLKLPLRIGLGFAPSSAPVDAVLTETQRQELLERVAAAFRGKEGVAGIDVIPSHLLSPKGGFANLDQLRGMYGIDLMALVSYEQSQFDEANKASLTYWTIVGAYFVAGDDTDTHTFVDTAVFDIRSRALLFNAAGTSRIQERSTLVDVAANLRERRKEGFDQAFDGMIAQLEVALDRFREQAATGTVRGAGTPALEVVRADGTTGGIGAGAFGPIETALALGLGLAALGARSRRGRAR